MPAATQVEEMLHGKALWGEAMRAELSQFREQGYFLSPEPLIDAETMALIDKLQREIEPEWRANKELKSRRPSCPRCVGFAWRVEMQAWPRRPQQWLAHTI